tara:strand:- start:2816 stop:3550 length:735 start_codon:yes stop_codon:yes gene_type:complete
MEKIHIVTYATHSDGLLDKLKNNKYNKEIEILGWGTKFNTYIDKIKYVNKYIENKKNNDILIYIDGFDTLINRNFTYYELKKLFLKYKTKILISEDPGNLYFITNKYIANKIYNNIFGNFSNNDKPNMGMFMGYIKELKELCKCIISQNIDDDQKALLKCYKNIKIDKNKEIFLNTKYNYYIKNKNKIKSIFVSFPFGFTNTKYDNNRISRYFILELKYYKYCIFIIIILILLILLILFRKNFF